MPLSLLVASSDEQFRESLRDHLLNQPDARLVNEYPDVSANLHIRVLQDLDRHPEAALIIDLSSNPEEGHRILEKVRLAAPDLYIIAADFAARTSAIR